MGVNVKLSQFGYLSQAYHRVKSGYKPALNITSAIVKKSGI
jgi:hypothetical protein